MAKRLKKTGNYILFLAVLLFPGWGISLLAQKPMVSLTISDKKVAPDESVTIIVTTNLNGTVQVDYPTEFIGDYGILHGMEPKMDPNTGKVKTYYYVQESGAFRKAGTYTFVAHVQYRGNEYRSNKLTVVVSESEEDDEDDRGYNSKEPIFGVIQAKKTTVYEGEPVLLKAKVFSRYDIYFLEGYKPFKADKNAEEHIFQNQRQHVEETRYNGRNVLTFDYGKQLLFPVSTGRCKIQPFEMALRCHTTFFDKTIAFKSSSAVITVKPLPDGAPKTFIGGVGDFGLSQLLGKTKLKQGDVFSLTLVVEGLGNLHNINAPLLDLPKGCSVYGDPERKEDYHFTEEGVEGTITFVYNIQVMASGKVHFNAQSISWFNPDREEYLTASAEPFDLTVERDASFQPIADHTQQDSALPDVGIRQSTKAPEKKESANQTAIVVSVVTPICLLGLLIFLFVGKRKRKEEAALESTDKSCFDMPAETQDYWQLSGESLEDKNQFAIVLPKAIIQQIEKRTKHDCLNRERALSLVADKHPETSRELRGIIEICDQFRYGFGDAELDTHGLFERTSELLKSL